MDSLKQNSRTIALGIAAAVLAGIIIWKVTSVVDDTEDSKKPADKEKNSKQLFFMEKSLSKEEKQKALKTWLTSQIESLLESKVSNVVAAPNGILSKDDFDLISSLIENNIKV